LRNPKDFSGNEGDPISLAPRIFGPAGAGRKLLRRYRFTSNRLVTATPAELLYIDSADNHITGNGFGASPRSFRFQEEVNRMVALSGEIKEVFNKTKVMPMATASKSGVPNVAPMASIQLIADDTVWIMDNYMVKTLENLKENPVVALYFYDQETKRCFQVKGDTEIKTSGADYEKFRDQVKAKGHKYPAKSLIVIKITDVFECTPGKEAGKKVL
jgi:hypothetical protein